MHSIQQKILALSETENLSKLTLRQIGEAVGDTHPQKIKHHLDQLFKKGFLKENNGVTFRVNANQAGDFYMIPVVGAVNCGQAVTFADENIEGYLTVSPNMLHTRFRPNTMFAVKAVGSSMNRSSISGKNICDGDYVIIDNNPGGINDYKNKYVLSVINGMANIKKFTIDEKNQTVVLISESTEDFPPIIIHQEDFGSYMVNGIVADVVKAPVISD